MTMPEFAAELLKYMQPGFTLCCRYGGDDTVSAVRGITFDKGFGSSPATLELRLASTLYRPRWKSDPPNPDLFFYLAPGDTRRLPVFAPEDDTPDVMPF
jgi:hypothetical protein